MKTITLIQKRLAGITQNLVDLLTKDILLKTEIIEEIEIIAEAEITAVIETQIEEIIREINQAQVDEIILETSPEIETRGQIEISVTTEIEKTIAKVVVIIVRIKNMTKIVVEALARLETKTLPTIERVDMIGAEVEIAINLRDLQALEETFTKVTNSPV